MKKGLKIFLWVSVLILLVFVAFILLFIYQRSNIYKVIIEGSSIDQVENVLGKPIVTSMSPYNGDGKPCWIISLKEYSDSVEYHFPNARRKCDLDNENDCPKFLNEIDRKHFGKCFDKSLETKFVKTCVYNGSIIVGGGYSVYYDDQNIVCSAYESWP